MAVFEFKGVQVKEAPVEAIPKCPYCQELLSKIWVKSKGLGFFGKQSILMCPRCRAFLGYGAWRAR